jgi:hypothetical protein
MKTYFPIKIRIVEGKDEGKELVVFHKEIPIGVAFVVLKTNVKPNDIH